VTSIGKNWRGGVYVYRCRKPGALLRIPFISTHFGYVGETTSFTHRHAQHAVGGGRYNAVRKDWSDLITSCYRIPLPPWKWLLRGVETLAMGVTWPVYNVAKNKWNPRRIKPWRAASQRLARDAGHRVTLAALSFGTRHLIPLLTLGALALYIWRG
jgi:hypothetical protein